MKHDDDARLSPDPSLIGSPACKCRWFLACDNPATTMVSHPIMGAVPTCARCAERARK